MDQIEESRSVSESQFSLQNQSIDQATIRGISANTVLFAAHDSRQTTTLLLSRNRIFTMSR